MVDGKDEVDYKKLYFYVIKSLSHMNDDMRKRCPAFGRSCCGICTKMKLKAKEYKSLEKTERFKKCQK